MDPHPQDLERRVDDLAAAMARVENRLERLEASILQTSSVSPVSPAVPAEVTLDTAELEPPPEIRVDAVGWTTLLGRTLLALAGAFLLRAVTSEGILPELVGAIAALLYAAVWLVLADRARGAANVAFHSLSAIVIAVPLIYETTTRFALLAPAVAAVLLVGFGVACVAVAVRRDLRSPLWIGVVGVAPCALFLGGAAAAPVPFAIALTLLAVAVVEAVESRRTRQESLRGWGGTAWIVAAFADLALLLLVTEDPIALERASLVGVLLAQALFFVLVGGGAARRIFGGGGGALLVARTVAALGLGYGGAVLVGATSAEGARTGLGMVLGVVGAALAVGAYAVGLWILDREEKTRALYFNSAAWVLMLLGSALLLPRPALLWAALALLGAAAGSRRSRFTFSLHGALYALAALVASELWRNGITAWIGISESAPQFHGEGLAALVAAALCLAFPVRAVATYWRRWSHLPHLLLLVLVIWGSGAVLIALLGPPVAGTPPDAALLAVLRTAVVALAALGLALLSRSERWQEAAMLVPPVLILGGIKLLVEDLPSGRPTTLFASFALYGAALILAPRLRRNLKG